MKTKTAFLLSCLFITFFSFSQLSAVDYKDKQFDQFSASKTYVVLTGNKKYDSEIQDAIKDVWKVTPFEFVKGSDFDKKISDKSASFLVLVDIELSSGHTFNYLALINGGKNKLKNYEFSDLLAYCPINHFGNESNSTYCYYRVRNMVESMISAMKIVRENDFRGNQIKIADKLQKFYNNKSKDIPNRTLLFCDETLGSKINQNDIAGLYPFKFEVCTKAKLEQVIKDKSTAYYYYQPGITTNKTMFVFDPSNGEVVYYDEHLMGLNINKDNIKDLVKTINDK